MRWGFIVDITECKGNQITQKVRGIDTQVATSLPLVGPIEETPSFKASIIFFQSSKRWRKEDAETPRGDRGDLDNMVKNVFDGLGPIIGFRSDWKKVNGVLVASPSTKPADSRILELFAKKVNSGSSSEMVSVEIETLT